MTSQKARSCYCGPKDQDHMRVYFHIDELNRDSIVASKLKRRLKQMGHSLEYGSRMTSSLAGLFNKSFDVIIIPRPHFICDQWGKKSLGWNTRFITLATENLGMICIDPRYTAKTILDRDYFEGRIEHVQRIDRICVWGERQKNAIAMHAPEVLEKVCVVGHPRHDKTLERRNSHNTRDDGNIIVGITPRSVLLNDYYDRSPMQGFRYVNHTRRRFEFFNKRTNNYLESHTSHEQPAESICTQALDVSTTIKLALALQEQNISLQFRIHPKENQSEWEYLLKSVGISRPVFIDGEIPIRDWLGSISYLIGPPSTTFYDALMCGVEPISLHRMDSRRLLFVGSNWEDNNRLMQYIFAPQSISELVSYVKTGQLSTLDSGKFFQVLRDEANYPDCQKNAINKVASTIDSLCKYDKSNASLLCYYLYQISGKVMRIYWRVKFKLLTNGINSSRFILGSNLTRRIDGLSSRST